MPRLLLLDGHSLAYRAFYALPYENFATSSGQHTNAVYGFVAMLINVLRDEEPTHLAVAFDVSRKTFRSEEYSEYKATRSATPAPFAGQVDLLKEVLDALRIQHVSVDGFEADDIIATLTTLARAEEMEVLICTGDRDALQLVDAIGPGSSTVLYPVKGVSELARMTPEVVSSKYGVPPERYSDLAALVGETSDNLPGVPGVGPKTAAKWITTYGDLNGLVAHVNEITGKTGDALREHLDQVLRNRRLNHLVRDLELPVSIAELERADFDREAVHTLFDALEFRVLRERLFTTFGVASSEASGGVIEIEPTELTPASLPGWLSAHASGSVALAVHLDQGDALGVALAPLAQAAGDLPAGASSADDGPVATAWIDLVQLPDEATEKLAAWLADPAIIKVLHEAKTGLRALTGRGLTVNGIDDLSLAAYLLKPDQRSYALDDLLVRYTDRRLEESEESSAQGMLDFGDESPAEARMQEAAAVALVSQVLRDQVIASGSHELLTTVELPLVELLARMEAVGIAVDEQLLTDLEKEFGQAVASAQEQAWSVIGHEVNLGSPKQLQVVLFDELGMPKTKKTKTGYTTDAEALSELFARTQHPFLEALLAHRDATKLRATVQGLIKAVGADGRIHTTYQQTIAATGRLSSTDPNLQNIPIRTSAGRRIREAFVVGEGFESLMTADYSQIELRVMAHLSGDAQLQEAFASGEDLHRFVGARIFDVPPEGVTDEMRSKVKAMSYGLAYGLSAFGLSRQLGIATGEAQALMDDYFKRFGGVRDYLGGLVDEARKDGYTQTMLGRRRYLPDLTSDNRQRRSMAERMALNAPIQGSAADIMKAAMLRVDAALQEAGLGSRILLQVHDELVLEIAPGEADQVQSLVRECMGSAVEMEVPLDVSIGVGRSWFDAAH